MFLTTTQAINKGLDTNFLFALLFQLNLYCVSAVDDVILGKNFKCLLCTINGTCLMRWSWCDDKINELMWDVRILLAIGQLKFEYILCGLSCVCVWIFLITKCSLILGQKMGYRKFLQGQAQCYYYTVWLSRLLNICKGDI